MRAFTRGERFATARSRAEDRQARPLSAHHPEQSAAQPLADGELRKVDKEAGKLTLKHGSIANLDMPEMTMVFRVKDPAILDQVKVGDKVQFAADKVNCVLTVTNLEAIKQ